MTVTADLIRMSGTMVRSSKMSSSQSPNGRTDSSGNCSTSSFTGSLFPQDPGFINIFSSADDEETKRLHVMATWAASGMR